jgi:hypothetical protein
MFLSKKTRWKIFWDKRVNNKNIDLFLVIIIIVSGLFLRQNKRKKSVR